MGNMKQTMLGMIAYVRNDYQANRTRFFAELFAWLCSVTSAVTFAATVPDIPLIPLYMVFISGCVAAAWACWTRRSFGLLSNYVFMIVIDCVGLTRLLLH